MKKLWNISSIKNIFTYSKQEKYEFELPETQEEKSRTDDFNFSNINLDESETLQPLTDIKQEVFPSSKLNLDYITVKFNLLLNSDIKTREFTLTARNKQYHAFLLYIDGLTDTTALNHFVLKPLMLRNKANTYDKPNEQVSVNPVSKQTTSKPVKNLNLMDYIHSCLIPQNDVTLETNFEEIIPSVNSGNCALFVDTINQAFIIDIKNIKQRSISSPSNEVVIKGSQESFVEVLRTNTSILRRLVNNENLIIENITIGTVSKTSCALCYIKEIANDDLVEEVRYRLNNLKIDSLISAGQLEQLIEDNSNISLPQTLSTERPDRCTHFLLEGRVVILINGSPYTVVAPITFLDLIASSEDSNIKPVFSNLLRLIRVLSILISILLPGLYIAVTNFHQELLPSELLFSIVASRSGVPFSLIFELLIMELSFELIREAGVRIPSPIGATIRNCRWPYFRRCCCFR